jgi:hypothetical protein
MEAMGNLGHGHVEVYLFGEEPKSRRQEVLSLAELLCSRRESGLTSITDLLSPSTLLSVNARLRWR